MEHRLWRPKTAVFALLVVALALVVACGSAAPAAQQQQQQTGAAPAEQPRAPDLPAVLPTAAVQPAQAAVGAPTVAPQPTAMPAIADPGIRGGHINMVQYARRATAAGPPVIGVEHEPGSPVQQPDRV